VLDLLRLGEGKMRRLLKITPLLSGLFALYVAIGCLIGFALPHSDAENPGCFPYGSTFGVFLWKCTSAAADLSWNAVVGWPRSLIIPPALVFASIKATVKNHFHYWFVLDGVPFIPQSFLLALVLYISFVYWWSRSKALAIGLTATLLGEVLYLGWLE
jgi:hypothetical protein